MKDPRNSTVAEAALLGPRWAAVEAFGAANPLDEIVVAAPGAWLGIAATGTAYDATLQALRNLGLTAGIPCRQGDPAAARRHALPARRRPGPRVRDRPRAGPRRRGEDLVRRVADQGDPVRRQRARSPRQARRRVASCWCRPTARSPPTGSTPCCAPLLGDRVELPPPLGPPAPRTLLSLSPGCSARPTSAPAARTTARPCCPRARSAAAASAATRWSRVSERPDSQVLGLTQMGGEGSQWIGQSPFTDVDHIFQNVGDGTFFHSGQLALQACVAAGVNITYKLLYNQVVAMTGAQNAEGGLTVAAADPQAEGGARSARSSSSPTSRRSTRSASNGLAAGVTVRDRDDLDAVQKELREVPGVTVLIYDQQCANEARRLRKRGKQEVRTTRVVIDEATCEGCGDCGAKSNCLSVQPVETELGRKTRIDQTSCNTDYSCLDGDCPSFLTVQVAHRQEAGQARRRRGPGGRRAGPRPGRGHLPRRRRRHRHRHGQPAARHRGPAQRPRHDRPVRPGPGRAVAEGRSGHLAPAGRRPGSGQPGRARPTCVLGFDLLVAPTPRTSRSARPTPPSRSSRPRRRRPAPRSPTCWPPRPTPPDCSRRSALPSHRVVELDALGASEALFGSTAPANLLLVGAAYQLGALPFSASGHRGGDRAQRRRHQGQHRRLPLGPGRRRRPGGVRRSRRSRRPPQAAEAVRPRGQSAGGRDPSAHRGPRPAARGALGTPYRAGVRGCRRAGLGGRASRAPSRRPTARRSPAASRTCGPTRTSTRWRGC